MSVPPTVVEAIARRLAGPRTVIAGLLRPVEERPSMADALRTTGRVCSLLAALGVVTWATGRPYLFPSLGPSAYALAVSPSAATSRPLRVVGGHLAGVVGGLVAYHLLAPGLSVVHLPPAVSPAAGRLAASAVVALGLTSLAMLSTDLRHAPACATTLIVALGLMAGLLDGAIILVGVLVLVSVDRFLPSFGGVEDPPR